MINGVFLDVGGVKPLRPVVDRKILQFALAHTFTPGDFTITRLGGCRLNPQMARIVAREIGRVETKVVVSFMSHLNQQGIRGRAGVHS